MSTQQHNENKKAVAESCNLEMAYADALLDQIDTIQLEVQDIQGDIALLQTMENALDLISDNMARMRRIAQGVQQKDATYSDRSVAIHEMRNLMMVNILVAEETEFNGHFLFRDNTISMSSRATGELTLTTAKIPEINGVENGDFHTILDSLDNAARLINRQYKRINTVMRSLRDTYEQLHNEINILLKAYPRQKK